MSKSHDDDMEFSSDESELELDSDVVYKSIIPIRKLSLENRSYTLSGFHTLPPELLYYIFSYLDVRTLLQEVRYVSRYFYDFLCSNDFWDHRFAESLKSVGASIGPTISDNEHLAMQQIGLPRSTFLIETAKTLAYNKNVKCYKMTGCHYGDVHCVKMLSSPCDRVAISGSRDKTICIYNLNNLDNDSADVVVNTNTDHNGWVWTLDQEDGNSTKIVSGSWDSHVNIYEIGRGNLEKISDISVNSAILCSRFEKSFLLYGTYSKLVAGYDVRSGKLIFKLRNHTKPVLGLTSSDNFIWSTGEDNALSCYDRRAGKLFKRIRLERISSSIQYLDPYLWVGGYDGHIKCFKNDMKLVNKLDSKHTFPITDMHHSVGTTITSSKDGSVKVFSPNVHAEEWNSFQLNNDASCVDYNGGILMAGCCDNTVTFWKHDSI